MVSLLVVEPCSCSTAGYLSCRGLDQSSNPRRSGQLGWDTEGRSRFYPEMSFFFSQTWISGSCCNHRARVAQTSCRARFFFLQKVLQTLRGHPTFFPKMSCIAAWDFLKNTAAESKYVSTYCPHTSSAKAVGLCICGCRLPIQFNSQRARCNIRIGMQVVAGLGKV